MVSIPLSIFMGHIGWKTDLMEQSIVSEYLDAPKRQATSNEEIKIIIVFNLYFIW